MISLYIGAKHSGKSTWLMTQLANAEVVGVLMPHRVDSKEVLVLPSYQTYDLKPESDQDTLHIGRFTFSVKKFDQVCSKVIRLQEDSDITCLVIDEVGPLEVSQSGFWRLLVYGVQKLQEGKVDHMICIVRNGLENQVTQMIDHLGYKGVVAQIELKPVDPIEKNKSGDIPL